MAVYVLLVAFRAWRDSVQRVRRGQTAVTMGSSVERAQPFAFVDGLIFLVDVMGIPFGHVLRPREVVFADRAAYLSLWGWR